MLSPPMSRCSRFCETSPQDTTRSARSRSDAAAPRLISPPAPAASRTAFAKPYQAGTRSTRYPSPRGTRRWGSRRPRRRGMRGTPCRRAHRIHPPRTCPRCTSSTRRTMSRQSQRSRRSQSTRERTSRSSGIGCWLFHRTQQRRRSPRCTRCTQRRRCRTRRCTLLGGTPRSDTASTRRTRLNASPCRPDTARRRRRGARRKRTRNTGSLAAPHTHPRRTGRGTARTSYRGAQRTVAKQSDPRVGTL